MSVFKWRIAYTVLVLLAVVMLIISRYTKNPWLTVAGTLLILVALIFDFVFHRCPSCGKYLGMQFCKHCPHCGEEI